MRSVRDVADGSGSQPDPIPKTCITPLLCCIRLYYLILTQELKVYSECSGSLSILACFLHHMATSLGGFSSYCDLYHTDHPSLIPGSLGHTSGEGGEVERMECGEEEGEEGVADTPPPNLMNHLHQMLTGQEVSVT